MEQKLRVEHAFGRRLREARIRRNLSQKELADKIGSAQVNISQYENHRWLPKVPHLRALAEALGVTMGYLLGEEEMDWPGEEG